MLKRNLPQTGTFAVLCLVLGACNEEPKELEQGGTPAPSGEPWFEEQAQSSGLRFVHDNGATGQFYFPEKIGGGSALLDFDGDGYLDVFCVQSGKVDASPDEVFAHGLFRNRGDGNFEDVSAQSGIRADVYGMAVTAGDFDNDGKTDLYVMNVGRNTLLRNLGGGKFEDVTDAAGVGGSFWSTTGTFFDYDADGDLDLFVGNYVVWSKEADKECYEESGRRTYCGPHSYNAPVPDQLYRNEGDGHFTEITAEAGISASFGNALGVVCGDYNGDGRIDIFVANDRTDDQLWINLGNDRFRDDASLAGCAVDRNGTARAGMGVDTADIDNDGDLDLIVVNLHGELDGYFRNEGSYFFEETTSAGIGLTTRAYTRFGVGFVDFDNDGDLDIYQANGRVTLIGESHVEDPFAEPNVLLVRSAENKWRKSALQGGTREPLIHTSRGAAFGDFDNDGGMDIVVMNSAAPTYLLRNVRTGRGAWVLLEVLNEHGAPAIGASVFASDGERRLRRDVLPGRGYASSSDPRVHVGLGSGKKIWSLELRWVDGTREDFGPLEPNRVLKIQRGAGREL